MGSIVFDATRTARNVVYNKQEGLDLGQLIPGAELQKAYRSIWDPAFSPRKPMLRNQKLASI